MSARIRITLSCEDCGAICSMTLDAPMATRRITIPRAIGARDCDRARGWPALYDGAISRARVADRERSP